MRGCGHLQPDLHVKGSVGAPRARLCRTTLLIVILLAITTVLTALVVLQD